MKLQLKRSNVLEGGAAKEPTAPQMEYGELAVNYNNGDPAIFLKDSNDNIIRIAGAGNINSGDNPSGDTLPPTGNEIGDMFFNTTNNTMYYWDGTEWVPIANDVTAADIFVGTLAEINAEVPANTRRNGFLWWNVEDGTLYIWYIDDNTSQFVVAIPSTGGGASGGANVAVLNTPPLDPDQGDMWWNTVDGRLYIWYQDVDSGQWVDASPDNSLPDVIPNPDDPALQPGTLDDRYVNITGDTMTGDLTVPNLISEGDIQSTSQNGGQLAGFRNQLINGDFRVVQRDAAGEAAVSRKYTCDRWYVHNDDTATYTWDQIDATGDLLVAGFAKVLRVRNASNVYQVRQLIELPAAGQSGQFLEGTTWTVSCYSTVPMNVQIGWRADAVGIGVVTNIISATAMTDAGGSRYTYTFTMPATAPDATALALEVSFLRTDGTTGATQITGCQFEPGPVATPFEHRPYGTELALCQRYYYAGEVRYVRNESYFFVFPTTPRVTPTVTGNANLSITVRSSGFLYIDSVGNNDSVISYDAEL